VEREGAGEGGDSEEAVERDEREGWVSGTVTHPPRDREAGGVRGVRGDVREIEASWREQRRALAHRTVRSEV
jgi:hypothetical protein